MRRLLSALAAALLAAGCSAQPASTQTPSVSASGSAITTPASLGATASGLTTPSTAPTPGVATITIVLKNGKVSPNGDRVMLDRGQPFVLDITSDRDDEVHVHGFDEQVEVKAGDHVKLELIAGQSGRFEVESHHPEMLIVVLQVR